MEGHQSKSGATTTTTVMAAKPATRLGIPVIPPGSEIDTQADQLLFANKQEYTHNLWLSYASHPFGTATEFIAMVTYLTGLPFHMYATVSGQRIEYYITATTDSFRIYMSSNQAAIIPQGSNNYTMFNLLGYNFRDIYGGEVIPVGDMYKYFDSNFIYSVSKFFGSNSGKFLSLRSNYYGKYSNFLLARLPNEYHLSKLS